MDYNNTEKSGKEAFLKGVTRFDNPAEHSTHANARSLWFRGWDAQEKIDGCIGPNFNAVKGVGHSTQCQIQHESHFKDI